MLLKEIEIADLSAAYESPAAELVQLACEFESKVTLSNEQHHINAKSIMGIMAFPLREGQHVQVETEGPDEESALAAIEKYLMCSE